MEEFHFLRPFWLTALVPFWFIVWRTLRSSHHGGAWSRACDLALLPFVLRTQPVGGGLLGIGATLAGTLAIIALAGPVWERLPVPVFRGDSALVIALDLSRSMNAEDQTPSRLQRAKFRIADILRLRTTGQTALIVFAAQSFIVTPLTDDTDTIAAQLQALDTEIIPKQGSEPAGALEQADQLLRQAGIPRGHVLLITDGAEPAALERAYKRLASMRHRLSVLGMGTAQGAPLPDQSGGFLRNPDGEMIVSRLAASELGRLARTGGGIYLEVTADDSDLTRLNSLLDADLDADVQRLEDLASSQWREFGPWLLLPLLPLAALGFRRGILVLAVALMAPMLPQDALATWWQTPDQAAYEAFEEGAYESAAKTFENDRWRGAAHYRAGAFEDAVQALSDLDDIEAHYNRGNALSRIGRFEEAIAAYEAAIAKAADHEDAAYNKALIEKLLQEEASDQQNSNDQDDGSEDDAEQSQGSAQDGGLQGEATEPDLSSTSDADGENTNETEPSATANEEADPAAPDTASEREERADEKKDEKEQTTSRTQLAEGDSESDAERTQATEQWLRRIPDDPAGLLRRKFQYQYKRLYGDAPYQGDPW